MFSRFFKTSQPFHYLMGILTLAVGSLALLWLDKGVWEWGFLIAILGLPMVLLLAQFIVIKNELTGQNSYMLYAATMLLLAALPMVVEARIILVLLLLLLSLRRLLSLKSGSQQIRKIFDATFWACLAALIEPLSVSFLIVVFVGVFLFARNKWNHWVTPFLAIVCVAVLAFTIDLFSGTSTVKQLMQPSNYYHLYLWEQDFSSIWLAWLFCASAVIGTLIYVVKLVDVQQRVRPRFSVLVFFGICASLLVIFEQVNYTLVLAPVLAIFLVRSLESLSHKVMREALFLLPFLLLLLSILLG